VFDRHVRGAFMCCHALVRVSASEAASSNTDFIF
jgi:hypothetical protein